MWSVSESDNIVLSGDLDDKQLKSKKHENYVLSVDRIAKKMKLKFTKAWIAYLRFPLPLDVYKEVLINLHQAVIPHLSNPIMLCDFLTKSYDVGEFSVVSYASILGAEITQRVKQVPLAFYKTTSSSLFSENDFNCWAFQSEETSQMIMTITPKKLHHKYKNRFATVSNNKVIHQIHGNVYHQTYIIMVHEYS